MLYKKNHTPQIDLELFKNPTAEYRCAPFWAWNCDLKKDELLKQIDYMREMGMGGFHMHPRVGMSTKYLSDDFMAFVRDCTEHAKENNMLAWLYDEDKWPSGFAGGYVTKKRENRKKHLLFTAVPNEEFEYNYDELDASARSGRSNDGQLLALFDIVLDANGYLSSYRRINSAKEAKGTAWYCYLEYSENFPWFNFQSYVDTLSKSAIDEFIATTHERYKQVIGDEFDKTVPAIFTDEPQVSRKSVLACAADKTDLFFPYTTDFDDTYFAEYGERFIDKMPEIVWDKKGVVSVTRYRYHNHVTEHFARAFCDNVGSWCEKNGIAFTGHMMEEPTLHSQTAAVGEAMRSYKKFTIPGVDMLCDNHEYTTVKQAASAAHQYGREGVLSELYGVTNWDFDFRGHKLQGDWQAALGVSVRVPHLYWVSMQGEAKRDYPASIGHQSAWYKEYSYIEDHFARVNTLMTRGKPHIKIGVIHPIESYWINFGPNDLNGDTKKMLEDNFADITDWLISSMLDFDFICESTLPEQYKNSSSGFTVGEMSYDVVLVPSAITLRSTTVKFLDEFAQKGGNVIFAGNYPTHIDALPSDRAKDIKSTHIDFTKNAVTAALEPYRTVKVLSKDGYATNDIIYGMRDDGNRKNLFLCRSKNSNRMCISNEQTDTVYIKGEYAVTVFDTLRGTVYSLPVTHKNGETVFTWHNFDQSSLLFQLSEKPLANFADTEATFKDTGYVSGPVDYRLSEPNVCVLDKARWRLDDGEWQAEDESIKIAVAAKDILNLSTATVAGAQPWAFEKTAEVNTIELVYDFVTETECDNVRLAIEEADITEISFDGVRIDKTPRGNYVDSSLLCVDLPKITVGHHSVTLKKPFGVTSNTENIFLLGNFGVSVTGTSVKLCDLPEKLYFCDLTRQGLPFYGGEVTYILDIATDSSSALALGTYGAGCVTAVAGGEKTNISLSPNIVDLSRLTPGKNTVELHVYTSRINTFGQLHLNNGDLKWFGSNSWRTEGADYAPEYNFKPTGLLSSPRILEKL